MQAGDTLDGQFTLLERIGRGGMGEVFRARHHESNSEVAIKVVSRSTIGELLMARLEREAQAAAAISSPHIPRVIAIGKTSEGEVYLVMQLLHGESLSERMKRAGGRLSWPEIHRIGDHVLSALRDAHAAGVVHRDLKPGNVFLETDSAGILEAKILDFGVCKFDVQDAEKLTITGESVGTIAYMAPEQIRGASKVDGRADLYSFAMVVFEMMSGRLPFDAQGQMALLASKLERAPRRLSEVCKEALPAGLDDLLHISLSRDPDLRPASANEMLSFWHGLVNNDFGIIETVNMRGQMSSPPTPVALSASTGRTTSRSFRQPHKTAWVAIGSAGITAAVAIALLLPRLKSSEAVAPQEETTAVTIIPPPTEMMPVSRSDIEIDHGVKPLLPKPPTTAGEIAPITTVVPPTLRTPPTPRPPVQPPVTKTVQPPVTKKSEEPEPKKKAVEKPTPPPASAKAAIVEKPRY